MFNKKCVSTILFFLLFVDVFNQYSTCRNIQYNVDPILIEVSWDQYDYDLKTYPSVLVPANPLSSRQFSPIDNQIYTNLKELNSEFARYGAWFPFPHISVAELEPPSGIYQCGNVATNYSVNLSCERNNGNISKIDFASFGTATGRCGQMTQGTCHAQNSSQIVEQLCLGKQTCSIPATAKLFGDPCFGTVKRLLVQIECDPPQNNTYYNFTYMDPTVKDFLDATEGHSRVVDFCTQPNWLFQQESMHLYPNSPIEVDWSYAVGTQFIDDTLQALGDYYGRVLAWYTRGGFIDEYGRKHISGYEYSWDYTEIFNEIDMEHHIPVDIYTKAYDAVIQGIRRHTNNYDMKYVGLVLGFHNEFDYYKYFLNHSNHAPDIPIDFIAYHFYALATNRTDPYDWESFFSQLDNFTSEVQQIEQIRKSLSPETRTTIDELGTILPNDNAPDASPFPPIYWNAASALYAYAWGQLSRQGIDVIAHSQLVGYPAMPNLDFQANYPSVTMLDWTTGQGTAKYWTTKLLIETTQINSDQARVTKTTDPTGQYIYSQAFQAKDGHRWVLLVNKKYSDIDITLPGSVGGQMRIINETCAYGPPIDVQLTSNQTRLSPFAVAIIHMP